MADSCRLLVSVLSAAEAEAALAGGADLIDVKEPRRGSLGRADAAVIAEVVRVVAGRVPVSAALGELIDAAPTCGFADLARETASGIAYLKWGLSRCRPLDWRGALRSIPPPPHVVTVAYADAERAQAPPVDELVAFAAESPGGVLLIDTFDKSAGKNLLDWLSISQLADILARCRDAGTRLALAGSLAERHVAELLPLRPDWFAVRGAACDGGRDAAVSVARVRRLADLVHGTAAASRGS